MAEMFASGLELLGAGMGIVFLFLTLLVILVTAMTWIIQRFFAESSAPAPVPRPQPAAEDEELIAAISAAVHRYRHRSR